MKCSQRTCDNEATHTYVWDEPLYCCDECKWKVYGVAQAMGFPTPARTMRPLTPQEVAAPNEELTQ